MTTPERKGIRRLLTYSSWKGIIDRVLALILIVLTLPIMALIALLIRLDSTGSPIFCQERVGKDGLRFTLYKFRSMYINHDDSKYKEFIRKYVQENASSRLDENGEDAYELINDPRVTRLGVLLRKTNLDELPQLFNVLKGDMSFVGPRPDIPFAVEMYQAHHRKRFSTTPGLTGLWQISARKHLSFDDMALLDSEYIERQSLLLDTKILLMTIGTVIKGNGS
jgi:lipopolysaccharide/colanic/teichoic acid biosynthesis glycosyltransferase